MTRARVAALACLLVFFVACGGGSSTGGTTVNVNLVPEGCDPPALTAAPGKTTFHIENKDADNITEFELTQNGKVVGEKENLTPGLSGEFDVDLKEGPYTMLCPGGTKNASGTLTVTAAGSSPAATDSASGSAAGACAPSENSATPTATLDATLVDYTITLSSQQTTAGSVAINATNNGPHPHEIVVVKDVAPSDLPKADDGTIDEDKLPSGAKVGEIEKFAPGNTCSATFDLAPGNYTLFCNVSGGTEGPHAKLGMVTTLTVS